MELTARPSERQIPGTACRSLLILDRGDRRGACRSLLIQTREDERQRADEDGRGDKAGRGTGPNQPSYVHDSLRR